MRPPPTSPLFPYTTLFRSEVGSVPQVQGALHETHRVGRHVEFGVADDLVGLDTCRPCPQEHTHHEDLQPRRQLFVQCSALGGRCAGILRFTPGGGFRRSQVFAFLPAVGERVSVSSGRPSSSATRRAIRAPLASQVKREAHARQACRTSSARQGSDSSLSARATTSARFSPSRTSHPVSPSRTESRSPSTS